MAAKKKKVVERVARTIPAPVPWSVVRAACWDRPVGTATADQQPFEHSTWLIQRGHFRDVAIDTITGLDSAFMLDYMGSAEFEFGALPQSLKAVAQAFPEFVVVDTGYRSVDDEPLFIVCHQRHTRAVIEALPGLIDGTTRTKEGVRLHRRLSCDEFYMSLNLWWDIRNHWFALLGTAPLIALQQAVHKLRIKWGYSDANLSEAKNGV